MTRPAGDLHVVVIAAAIAVLCMVQGASAQAWTSFLTKTAFDQKFFPDHLPFYSYEALKAASKTFPAFGSSGTVDVRKRELAAFFAHVKHESRGLMEKYEQIKGKLYCNDEYRQYRCAPGKGYIGRGPLQLTWNYNYGKCGEYLKLDLLNKPSLALRDGKTAFQTALWFWMINVGRQGIIPHKAILEGSFSRTTKAINGDVECSDGGHKSADGRKQQESRIMYYRDFCKKLNVAPGTDLSCWT